MASALVGLQTVECPVRVLVGVVAFVRAWALVRAWVRAHARTLNDSATSLNGLGESRGCGCVWWFRGWFRGCGVVALSVRGKAVTSVLSAHR